jgi:hypothetical protein
MGTEGYTYIHSLIDGCVNGWMDVKKRRGGNMEKRDKMQ